MRRNTRKTAGLILALCLSLLGLLLAPPLAPPALAIRSFETEVAMPNVKGKRLAEAEKILKETGFDSIQIYDTDTDKRGLANVVKDQLPPAGREVKVGVMIKLTVYRYNP